MTPERLALAEHAIATVRAVAEHIAATPPREPRVLVWRRRCSADLTGSARLRWGRVRPALHAACGFTGAHAVHAILGAVLAATATCEHGRLWSRAVDARRHEGVQPLLRSERLVVVPRVQP